MNNLLENKLSMYQKVQGYLTLHAAATAGIPLIATLKTQLDTEVSTLQSIAIIADADVTGETVDKQLSRASLKNACLKVSTAIVVHASMNSINSLLEKCDESPASLDNMRDNDFYTYCQTVSQEATTIIASLAAYNCLPADLTTLNTASASFLAIIQKPRLEINERSNAKNDLLLQFEKIDEFLRSKVDKAMMLFITSNASLYNGYKSARAIDDDGGSATAPDYDMQVEAGQTLLIANIPYLSGRTFKCRNNGNEELEFALSETPDNLEGVILVVPAGVTSQRLSSNLNSSGTADNFLVRNNGSSSQAFKVWITE